jgi:thiosulfate dehydrogenase
VTRARAAGLLAPLALLAAGCGAEPAGTPSPVERGRALFTSAALSPSKLNDFTCATCHDAGAGTSDRRKPGAAMAGVTRRPSFWGGQENDLLRSIDDCRALFMEAEAPLDPADPDADALYAYLDGLAPGDVDPVAPVAFTVVQSIADVPRGDASSGQFLFAQSCAACHGAMHTGAGRLDARVPALPDETLAAHATYGVAAQRLVFIEKIRHGGFFGYGGDMPPFSLEVLPDAAVSDILEALGVLGE